MIKTYNVRHKTLENCILLLGFFDCLHIGHTAMAARGKQLSESKNCSLALLTFTNDPSTVLGREEGCVLNFNERVSKAERLGIDMVLTAEFDEEFKNLSADEFFDILLENHHILAVVCGYDFTYGNGAKGNVETLKARCLKENIELFVEDKQTVLGERISTTLIKEYLLAGNISAANALLGEPYSLIGKVESGRRVGGEIGFPTANIAIPKDKMPIKFGVYSTHAEIDGKVYRGITNYGNRPTFFLDSVLTETHFDGFTGDIYGKEICLYFDEYLRPIRKFDSINELISQIGQDLENIR